MSQGQHAWKKLVKSSHSTSPSIYASAKPHISKQKQSHPKRLLFHNQFYFFKSASLLHAINAIAQPRVLLRDFLPIAGRLSCRLVSNDQCSLLNPREERSDCCFGDRQSKAPGNAANCTAQEVAAAGQWLGDD
jgi:hypothetical protein